MIDLFTFNLGGIFRIKLKYLISLFVPAFLMINGVRP